ncbi:MAG: hypothetical protein HDQ98_16150 [Lachnospiraceae bacterium]|nr:hypothetical protein [Lachnospiraceae bacterium]MBD5533703.1 hypothetical protein [Lachnospiraceae bacterium]
MEETIKQFFVIVGFSMEVPQTFPELLQWFVYILIALMLVLAVFRLIGSICSGFISFGNMGK